MLPVVMLGSLLSCAGFVGASFSTSLLQLYVLYGIVAGIGLAMLLLVANICIIKTFKNNASLAAGIAVCGSGIGTFVISQLIQVLIDSYGWRGALFVQGGITLHGVICGLLVGGYLSNLSNKAWGQDIEIEIAHITEGQIMTDLAEKMDTGSDQKNTNEQDQDVTKGVDQQKSFSSKIESMCDVNSKDILTNKARVQKSTLEDVSNKTSQNSILQTAANGVLDERNTHGAGKESVDLNNGVEGNADTSMVKAKSDAEYQPSKSCAQIFNLDLLTNVKFLVVLASICAVSLAFWVPFHLLPDQVKEINSSRQIATWIVSSIGIANIIGRVLFGWLGNFRRIRRSVLVAGILFALGITTGSSTFLISVETKLLYGCSFGLLIGGFFALLPVVLSDLFGADVWNDHVYDRIIGVSGNTHWRLYQRLHWQLHSVVSLVGRGVLAGGGRFRTGVLPKRSKTTELTEFGLKFTWSFLVGADYEGNDKNVKGVVLI